MVVVSVSLPDKLVAQMDEAIAATGQKGRSAFMRTAVRELLNQQPADGAHVHGSITLAYRHGHEAKISELRHQFHDVVLSMMHTHCEAEECMDVLLVGGPMKRIQEMHLHLQSLPIVDRCQLAVIHGNKTSH